MTIVLLDGIWGKGAVFQPLRNRLHAAGYSVLVPTLRPTNAVHGVSDLAEKLRGFINSSVGLNRPLTIVGFSLGCIVARTYLQELGGHRRTRAFFALSGPHHGTFTAYGYIGQGARDLRPGSGLLRKLEETSSKLSGIRLYAYWTPFDLMILPATSARWPQASNLKVWSPLHRFMPGNSRVQADILLRLEQLCVQPSGVDEAAQG